MIRETALPSTAFGAPWTCVDGAARPAGRVIGYGVELVVHHGSEEVRHER